VTTPQRFILILTLSAFGCSQPAIEKAGGGGKGGDSPGSAGNDGDGTGQGGSGRTGGTGGPDFGIHYTDAGVADANGSGPTPIGEGQSCAGELHEGKLVPLDLLMLLDISGSMEESAGMQSKWTALHEALLTFVKDPMSAGLGVGLETFPPPSKTCAKNGDCGATGHCEDKGVCSPPLSVATTEPACDTVTDTECASGAACTKYGICAKSGLRCAGGNACPGGAAEACTPRPKFCVVPDSSCPLAQYQTPVVPIADLPGAVPALETAMAGIVPQGTTPTTPAVKGALAQLQARAMSNPNRKPVLVLATDGLPTECGVENTIDTAVAAIGAGQMATPAIPTYVIGIFGANQLDRSQSALMRMATAGGTGMPFVLTTGNDLNKRLLAAINQIRGSALGCEFAIPRPDLGKNLNYDEVNVRVKTSAGTEDLLYVGSAAGCDPVKGGWYYDADPKLVDPKSVLLCDATCKKVKAPMSTVSVDLRLGCKTIIK
jgi:hypothetical protein